MAKLTGTDPQYRLCITMTQETDGKVDDRALVEEFSSDKVTHIMKTKVWVKHFSKALNDATQELADMGLEAAGGELKLKV